MFKEIDNSEENTIVDKTPTKKTKKKMMNVLN